MVIYIYLFIAFNMPYCPKQQLYIVYSDQFLR